MITITNERRSFNFQGEYDGLTVTGNAKVDVKANEIVSVDSGNVLRDGIYIGGFSAQKQMNGHIINTNNTKTDDAPAVGTAINKALKELMDYIATPALEE